MSVTEERETQHPEQDEYIIEFTEEDGTVHKRSLRRILALLDKTRQTAILGADCKKPITSLAVVDGKVEVNGVLLTKLECLVFSRTWVEMETVLVPLYSSMKHKQEQKNWEEVQVLLYDGIAKLRAFLTAPDLSSEEHTKLSTMIAFLETQFAMAVLHNGLQKELATLNIPLGLHTGF